jgi:hypothetical protein
MKHRFRSFALCTLLPLLLVAAGCEQRPPTPGPGARSPTTGGDSNTQDGSSATGETTPGNRGGTPGGSAPGATPTNP